MEHLNIICGQNEMFSVSNLVIYSDIYPTRCNVTQFIYFWKLLYMFWVVLSPIIRSTTTVPTASGT